jgi:hypothetical protein
MFERGQRLGIDVLPRGFHSSVPDIAALRSEWHWRRPYSLTGIRGADVASRLDVLASWFPHSVTARADVYRRACDLNGADGYGPIEAELLYCFISTVRPARIVPVGAGVATAVILTASADAGFDIAITYIDPWSTAWLSMK